MSGGLVFEYVHEDNNFGLVVLHQNETAEILTDYNNLQAQYNKLNIKALESRSFSGSKLVAPTCKNSLIGSSSFNSTFSLPQVPSGGQALIDRGLKNPNNGKLVAVDEMQVSLFVYRSDGSILQNLAIKPLADDESNTPNGSNTSDSASTIGSIGQTTPTNKSSASHICIYTTVPAMLTVGVLLLTA